MEKIKERSVRGIKSDRENQNRQEDEIMSQRREEKKIKIKRGQKYSRKEEEQV